MYGGIRTELSGIQDHDDDTTYSVACLDLVYQFGQLPCKFRAVSDFVNFLIFDHWIHRE